MRVSLLCENTGMLGVCRSGVNRYVGECSGAVIEAVQTCRILDDGGRKWRQLGS
jgi:hypothetical protein